jgi:glyoxylase-like metal-dependent hydrolase (beta-lactamase superfamily II)
MRILHLSLLLTAALPLLQQSALVKENATVRVSDHVYVILDGNVGGVPNVGIVVGDRATLVIDTGLGLLNGQAVQREMQKVRKGTEVYVVATHFHSEHTLGESAFPASAKVLRARAQQRDMDEFGIQPNFATRSPAMAELMKDAKLRPADELFDTEKILDLGGVRVRITWVGGGTHTNGDTVIFVESDRVLFAGDVVMNGRFVAFQGTASVRSWISALDRLSPLKPLHVIPSHGAMGDATLIDAQRITMATLASRSAELKREGKTVDQTVQTLGAEIRAKNAGWTGNPDAAIRSAYAESPGGR